jgi:hypothetical protein
MEGSWPTYSEERSQWLVGCLSFGHGRFWSIGSVDVRRVMTSERAFGLRLMGSDDG